MVGWLSIFARYPYLNQNRSSHTIRARVEIGAERRSIPAAPKGSLRQTVKPRKLESNETFRRLQNSLSKNRFRQSKFTEMKWVLIGGDSEIARA